ncbi:hypothetical protein [Sphingomonas sp. UYP23]
MLRPNLRSRNGARCPQQLYQVNQRANIDVGSRSKRTLAQIPRSNIHAGTEGQRSDTEPPILQRKMFTSTRSTVS